MATITGLTAARMAAIEAASIISGSIISTRLILRRFDGGTVDAGVVVGAAGANGTNGTNGRDGAAGATGAKGVSTYAVTADLANISGVSGSAVGDYFINGATSSRTILGITAAAGDIILATSATAGRASGSLLGPAGAAGRDGSAGSAGRDGAAGSKGVGIYVVTADLANISGVSGSAIGDYFINGATSSRTILGVTAAPSDVVLSTSATAGRASGSLVGGPPLGSAENPQTDAAAARNASLPTNWWVCAREPTNRARGDFWKVIS